MILRICNELVEKVMDGGSSRDLALIELAQSVNGTVAIVRNEFFYRSKAHRLLRAIQLAVEVYQSPHPIVLLCYPGYPFFWRHKVTLWFFVSIVFSVLLFLITRFRGKHIIVDAVDLPLYQYKDLDLPMEMSERAFHFFDWVVFTLADEVWIASEAFGELAQKEYRLAKAKVKIVLNGAFRVEPRFMNLDGQRGTLRPFRFVYAGTMNSTRELESLLDAFVSLPYTKVELHLCGIQGEWIAEKYPDARIKFHGHLSQAEVVGLLRQCDVGVIPYPERGYYNMVFPSKFPLYVIGGVMLLGTNATGLARYIDRWKVGLHGPLAQMEDLMRYCVENAKMVQEFRLSVAACQESFYWDTIYKQALDKTLADLRR